VGAGPLISLVYGARFAPAAWALAVLALVLPARFVNTLLGTALNAADRQGARTAAVGGAAALNLMLNLALIGAYGFRGAVYATLVTEVALTAALCRALRPLRLPLAGPAAAAVACALATAAAMWIVPGHVLIRGAAGGAVALGCAVLLRSHNLVEAA
jgi:O-antigen/teichoic acid export membrane protein